MRRARRSLLSLAVLALAAALGLTLAPSAAAYPAGVVGTATINAVTFDPGDVVVVKVQHTTPGTLTMQIFSAPVTIGTSSVGRQGNGTVKGAIPAGYSGAHTIQVTGAGGEIYPFSITVTGAQVPGSTDAVIPSQTVYDEFHPELGYGALDTYSSYSGVTPRADYTIRVTATSDGYTDSSTVTADIQGGISDNTRFVYAGTDRAHWRDGETVVFSLVDPASARVLSTSTVALTARFSGMKPDFQASLDDSSVRPGQTVHVTGSGFSGGEVTGEITPGSIAAGSYESGILGGLRGAFTVPAGTAPGQYFLDLTDHGPGGAGYTLPFTVQAAPAPGTFVSLAPERLLDTREGTGAPRARIAAGGVLTLQVTGAGGVPSTGAAAVVLNITVAGAGVAGYVTAYPSGTARPVASNVNYPTGAAIAGLVTVRVGSGGKVALYNGGGGSIDLVADVAGYFAAGTATVPGAFVSLAPTRLLDTRTANGAPKAKVASRAALPVQIAGRGGVPAAGVSAVVLTVTVANATTPGYLTVYPNTTTPRPTVSNLNYEKAKPIANLVTVPVGTDGRVAFFNGGTTPVDVLADLAGYYLAGTATTPGAFVPVDPARILDTRTSDTLRTLSPMQTRSMTVAGNRIPSSGVDAVVLNVTAAGPGAAGYTTVYPNTVSPRPLASTVNFGAGQTIPNLAVLPLGSDGAIALYNGSPGPLDLVLDIAGYYLS